MEEIYQTYKESVNFLWVYSNEAHADSLNVWKQIKGYDAHPYSETNSMEERAQRAGWMKTDPDPDLDMPMMIDYLKSDMGEDNAIRKAYGGGSPYSGYIIDCDGKILEAHSWAWADMTQSWPMSVDSFENLIKSLDKYIENSSSCFKGGAEVSKKSGGVFDKKEVPVRGSQGYNDPESPASRLPDRQLSRPRPDVVCRFCSGNNHKAVRPRQSSQLGFPRLALTPWKYCVVRTTWRYAVSCTAFLFQ